MNLLLPVFVSASLLSFVYEYFLGQDYRTRPVRDWPNGRNPFAQYPGWHHVATNNDENLALRLATGGVFGLAVSFASCYCWVDALPDWKGAVIGFWFAALIETASFNMIKEQIRGQFVEARHAWEVSHGSTELVLEDKDWSSVKRSLRKRDDNMDEVLEELTEALAECY